MSERKMTPAERAHEVIAKWNNPREGGCDDDEYLAAAITQACEEARLEEREAILSMSGWPEEDEHGEVWFGEHAQDGWESAISSFKERIRARTAPSDKGVDNE